MMVVIFSRCGIGFWFFRKGLMMRHNLIDARNRRGWTQQEVVDRLPKELEPDLETYRRWEAGTQRPQPKFIEALCDLFEVKYPYELDLHSAFVNDAPTQCREDRALSMLNQFDRRGLLALLSRVTALAGLDLTAIFSATVIAPDHLLDVCRTVINTCWDLLDSGSFFEADILLTAVVSNLDGLATHASPYRRLAASYAAEATIIQMIIATHQMNYKRRAKLGEDAIRYGEYSGNPNVHVMTIGWHGDTFKNCYHQPDTALNILSSALPLFDGSSPLNQTDISIGMALAYALDRDETNARNYLVQARIVMPEQPELDPLYRIIGRGHAELDRSVGSVYLELAQRFPTKRKEYSQLAHDTLAESTTKSPIGFGVSSQTLIYKADAARLIRDMDDYLSSLMEGLLGAIQIDSKTQIAKANTVLSKAPKKWQKEARYTELEKLLNSVITSHQ